MSERDEIPDATPPFFWRRVWLGGTALDEVTTFSRAPDGATVLINVGVPQADVPEEVMEGITVLDGTPDGLVIYGRAVRSRYEEDRAIEAEQRARGLVFSECFSVMCLDGELGTHPLATVTAISREEFEAARERGWE